MQELIPIIRDNHRGLVNARELHAFLEVNSLFAHWIKRMLAYGFEENSDYTTIAKKNNRQILKEYILTLDTAKEIAMIQRTPKGKQARQYFLACEKALLESQKPKLPKFLDRYILNSNKTPLGYFSVINATFTTVYREMERVGYVLPDKGITGKDLMPDISIGRTFSDWLKKNGHGDFIKDVRYYEHEFVGRPSCDARMYPDTCYHLFTYFLKNVWIPQKARAYFKSKNPEALEYLPKLLAA